MFWYSLLTTLVGILIYPYCRIRTLFGSVVWRERLGLGKTLKPVDIWIHASSVGEVKVAETLIRRIIRKKDDTQIHLSVMTKAGYEIASKTLGSMVSISFLPLDIRFVVQRVFAKLNPKILIITETEIWPILISEANSRGAKVILVNGRMSTRSVKQYQRVRGLMQSIMAMYTLCFFKSSADQERFVSLGLPENNGVVAGDMKFDTTLIPIDTETKTNIRTNLGVTPDQFLIVAGSTRPGNDNTTTEEQILLKVYLDLKEKHPQLRLIIAPRHLDRVDNIIKAFEAKGVNVVRLESPAVQLKPSEAVIIVVAFIGGLITLYQAADLAFVGGTLVPVGGHNLLEPVWTGTPVLFGPSLDNVSEASDYIITNNYGTCVSDRTELTKMIESVITNKKSFAKREPNDTTVSATGRVIEWLGSEGLV